MSMIADMRVTVKELIETIRIIDNNSNIKIIEEDWKFKIIDEEKNEHEFNFDSEEFIYAVKFLNKIIQDKLNR